MGICNREIYYSPRTVDERLLVQQHVDLPKREEGGTSLKKGPNPNDRRKRGITKVSSKIDDDSDTYLPRYLAYSQNLNDFAVLDQNFQLKISCMGGLTFSTSLLPNLSLLSVYEVQSR